MYEYFKNEFTAALASKYQTDAWVARRAIQEWFEKHGD